MKAYNVQTALQYPDQITHLFIYNRNLDQVPEVVFRLKKLRVLSLSNNRLKELPDRLLELTALEEIDLSANQFEQFPEILTKLFSLKKIKIQDNYLQQLPPSIQALKKLELFNSANNQLEVIPDELFLPALKELNLAGNQLKKLSKKVIKSMDLEKLFLQKNKLSNLPQHLFHCSHLRVLQIDENRLKKLPEEIGLLQRLEKITFRSNKLTKLPAEIGTCTFLRELDGSENKLDTLPDAIGQLKWLFYLNVKKNKLNTLPTTVGKLKKLKTLNLEYNQLKELPNTWRKLSQLQCLFLKGNSAALTKMELLDLFQLKKISGLTHVFTTTERRQFLTFLKYSRQQKLTQQQRQEYYQLMIEDKLLAKKELIIALGFSMKVVREKAQQQLLKNHNVHQSITQQSQLTIVGRSIFNKKNVAAQLKKIGVTYQTVINENTSHVVLGTYPNQAPLLSREALTFLSEKELQNYLTKELGQYQEIFTPETITNLRRLLLSDQTANLRLAIQISQHTGFPKELITELFIAFKTCKTAAVKRSLRILLQLHASESLEQKMKWRLPLGTTHSPEKLLQNIKRYADGTELDFLKLEKYFIN